MACLYWEPNGPGQGFCHQLGQSSRCQGEGERCPKAGSMGEARNESLMRQAARLLAAAGGHRFRHYLIKVDSGRAMCIEEFDPPRPSKILV